MKRFLILFLLVVVSAAPLVAFAANPCAPAAGKASDLGACVSQVYIWSLGIAGMLAVIMCVWGGYRVMTARGNAAQATDGREYIWSSIIGLILLLGAYIILNTINTDLTTLNSPDLNQQQTGAPRN